MRHINSIIIHHSATKDSGTVSWQPIRSYHKGKGWRDIGYHFGIEKVGDLYETFVGRDIRLPGAHCVGNNSSSIGICVVGDFDNRHVNCDQWAAVIQLVKALIEIFPTITGVYGHNEFSLKSCPGKHFDMDALRREVL